MAKYVCDVCGWEYDPRVGDPEHGIEPGTPFEDLPDDFTCPLCGAGKDEFVESTLCFFPPPPEPMAPAVLFLRSPRPCAAPVFPVHPTRAIRPENKVSACRPSKTVHRKNFGGSVAP